MDRRGATSLPVLIEELSPVCLANFSRNMLSLNLLCTAVNPEGMFCRLVIQRHSSVSAFSLARPDISPRYRFPFIRPMLRSRCQCEGLICRYADANAPITNGNDFCDSFLPVGGEMEH